MSNDYLKKELQRLLTRIETLTNQTYTIVLHHGNSEGTPILAVTSAYPRHHKWKVTIIDSKYEQLSGIYTSRLDIDNKIEKHLYTTANHIYEQHPKKIIGNISPYYERPKN